MDEIQIIFNDLQFLASTSFAFAIRPFLISYLNEDAKNFWLDWISTSNHACISDYINSWESDLKLNNQNTPKYDLESLNKIRHFFIYIKDLSLDSILNIILKKIKFNNQNKPFIWCLKSQTWQTDSMFLIFDYVKKNMYEYLNNIDIQYQSLKFYLCEDVKHPKYEKLKPDTDKIRLEIDKNSTDINKKIKLYFKTNKVITTFNNQFPYHIGMQKNYIVNLKTQDYMINKYEYYFSNLIKSCDNILITDYCYPICDFFESQHYSIIQQIFGSFFIGDNKNIFYVFYGTNIEQQTQLLNIFKEILDEYFTVIPDEILKNYKSTLLESKYNLYEKRVAVINIYKDYKINETKLFYLLNTYKNCKFILNIIGIPNQYLSFNSTKFKLLHIPFNQESKEKKLKLDYDYIFSWLLEGCEKYINNNDKEKLNIANHIFSVDDFLNDKIEITNYEEDKIKFKDMYKIYTNYVLNKKTIKINERELISKLKHKLDFKRFKKGYFFVNVKLRL